VDELEVPPGVLAVTFVAFLFAGPGYPVVISPSLVDAPGDFLVTLQTLLIAGPLSEIVTLEAVLHALEIGMQLRKVPRRNLGASRYRG
jgi:hypothetical protein